MGGVGGAWLYLCGLEKGLFISVWEGRSFGADGSVLQFSCG